MLINVQQPNISNQGNKGTKAKARRAQVKFNNKNDVKEYTDDDIIETPSTTRQVKAD